MPINLKRCLPQAALAFRGYNVTNLGRTAELLEHSAFGPTVGRLLQEASDVCGEVTGGKVDLLQRVRERRETDLASYCEAIALIVAVEMAQLRLLAEFFDTDYSTARVSYGYSLGEVCALMAGGVFAMRDAVRIPLCMAADCVELAHDVTLAVMFSRGSAFSMDKAHRLCLKINTEGQGVIGISAILSPNSVLLVGQRDTVDRLEQRLNEVSDERLHIRRNPHRWPPLHTPIVWERNIPNRSSVMMHTTPGGFTAPRPAVFSFVTGDVSYNENNTRELLARWVDHPQRLWDAVYYTLESGIETVIHVGPQPNIIPATFHRLSVDVEAQIKGRLGMRALSGFIRRPWLQALLPRRAALLRAPLIRHIVLEDWLLDQPVP